MNPNRKRWLMSFIHGITILSMLVTMTVPMAALTSTVNAQDATQDVSVSTETPALPTDTPAPATDAPVVVTDVPTEAASPEVTTVVTDEATSVPTEEAPEATAEPTNTADVTEEPTSVPTEEATVTPSETPVSTLLFQDDFQDGDTIGWNITPGWQIVSEPDNMFLSVGTPGENATITAVTPADFVFTARVRVAAGNKAGLAFRSGTENYWLILDMSANTAALLKNTDPVGEVALIPPVADETGQIPMVWHTVSITAAGNTISATVDGLPVGSTFIDPNPLPAGTIVFNTDAANTGSAALDDVVINSVEPVTITVTPTAVPTEETTPESTATLEPTEEATPESTPEPVGQVILSADFESELQGWSALTDGASVVADGDANHALLLAPTANFLPGETIYLADFRLDMRLNITSDAQDGTASGISIPFRTQDGKSYVLSVEAGQTALYRNNGEGLTPLANNPTAHTLNTWHTLSLDATGGHLVITVDDVAEIDATEVEPLVSGQIAFVANSASSVLVDDIVVTDFSGVLAMSPTPEPMGLTEEATAKLPAGLVDVVALFVSGDEAGALALAKANFVPMDDQGLIQVVVWAAEGESGSSLSAITQTVGGMTDYVYDDNVEAHVPLAGFVALVNAPQISAIRLASLATSTGLPGAPAGGVAGTPAGTVVGEGFDVISANDWHIATTPVMGASQNIGLIDVGFGGVADSGEYSCMVSPPAPAGSDTHGANVLQILCDVAPSANVRLYRAGTASELASAIATASASSQIILITEDLGVDQGPGDGVGAGSPSAGVYTALNTATSAGDLVIVSAGNNNSWASDTSCVRVSDTAPFPCIVPGDPFPDGHLIGRYFSFNYTSGAAAISIPVNVKAGDTIRVGWNDWNGTLNGGAAEDFDIVLSGGITQTIHNGAAGRALPPGEAYPVTTANCPSGLCSATLQIGGAAGTGSFGDGGAVVFQVQISGAGMMDSNGVAGLIGGAGNLARPADAPNVLAVGAVCARPSLNYPLLRESSVGPIFAANGTGTGAVGTTPTTLKPSLVGPSDVSISGTARQVTDPSADGCRDSETNGFSGTSAAAAYIAAEAALIRSNGDADINPSTATASTIQNYLFAHTVDLYTGATPDGFDGKYGAGLAVLGNPAPDYPISAAGTALTDPTCTGGIAYVSPANASAATFTGQGSFGNPYLHVSEALADVSASACVILLPGEYVGGIYANSTAVASGVRLRSYVSANAGSGSPSIIWANNDLDQGSGAGIVIDSVNLSVEGLTFKFADWLDPVDTVGFLRPFALKIVSANGSAIRSNTFSGVRAGHTTNGSATPASAPVLVNDSQNIIIENNLFSNNDAFDGAALHIILSGTPAAPITIQRNWFKDNAATKNSTDYLPTIKIDDSRVNIYNNRFNNNSTKSIILVDDGSVPGIGPSDQNDFTGPEVQVFGNAFTRNTNSGPLVHLYPGRNFRFVNNTVAGNKSISAGTANAIILRGSSDPARRGGNGFFDIHNNVFYDNFASAGLGALVLDLGGDFFCDRIGSATATSNGAQKNWSFKSGALAGVCELPLSNPAYNNSIEQDDPGDPFDNDQGIAEASDFVGPTIAPDDPYQLEGDSFGFDIANESLITAFNAALINPGGVDALNKTRKSGTVDLGAYEFKPVTAGPTGTLERPEDVIETNAESPLNLGTLTPAPTKPVILIPLYASGGFGSYKFEIITTPQNYSTDTTNACGGQPIFYDPSFFDQSTGTGRALYCPPRHFYNITTGGGALIDPTALVTFQYRVRDGTGFPSDADTVTVKIRRDTLDATNLPRIPADDTALITTLNPYSAIGVLTDGPDPINIRLRPYARFGNFRLAAPGDASRLSSQDGQAGSMEAQYPYTYTSITFPDSNGGSVPGTNCGNDYNPTLFGASEGASEAYLSGRFAAISGGVMTVTPLAGQVGCFPIRYTARDANNSPSINNIVRIVVVGSLPDQGLHDDTSFSFDYHGLTDTDVGGWVPLYNEGTINNTLHQSVKLDDTAEFLFDGIGFALYMQGSTAGGAYEVKVENAGVPVTLSWSAVPGVTGQLQSTAGGINCRTSAILAAGQTAAPFKLLSNYNANQPYVVSCNGFLDGEANKVIVVNKQAAKQLNVDAIGILTDTDPLQPGIHEVTEAQLLPTFFNGWTPITDAAAVGQKAIYTSSTSSDFNFRFQGTGFALGTALQRSALVIPLGQPTGVQYKICVADTADPTDKVCQKFDNSIGGTTLPRYKVYRPFFGFDPTHTYDVSVDITNIPNYSGTGAATVKMKFYVDSIVVFNQKPTATLPSGITEDDNLGPIVFGGGLDDTWSFNTNYALASNKSLTSVVATVPKIGPFISFQIPAAADTINWFQVSPTVNTTQALVCVDRAQFNVAPSEFGNCIILNTRTGAYQQVATNGTPVNDPTPISTSVNPLVISEGMFRSSWPVGNPHTVEISSLTNEAFNLDKIQVIDSDGPLTVGYYEENVRNLRYFSEFGGVYTVGAPGGLENFTEVVLASASGGKYRLLKADNVAPPVGDVLNLNEGMLFQFNGTGFSVYFNFDAKADAVRICWQNDGGSPAAISGALVNTVLTTGTCQTYDNQSAVARYKAARTIAGLTVSNYTVVVQMLPDQNEPAAHAATAKPISMAIDAVQVYSNALPVNMLDVPGTRYETSFTNQALDGRFLYLGTGWKSVTGTAAKLYSGSNYDSIVNVIGAGVVFRTNNAANVVIYRDTRVGFAPMQVCVVRQAPAVRRCAIVNNNGGTGYQQPIVVPLFDATQHTVSIVTTDFGTFNLDAIGVSNTPLQPGVYDENNPALIYSNTTSVPNPINPVYSHWKDIPSTVYQDGGAMQSQLAATATPSASVQFQFTGTGFSLITQFDAFSGSLDADIDGLVNDYMNVPLNSYNAAAIYKSSHSVTGLPKDTYTVTITENDATSPTKRRRFTVDGVEIYGTSDPTGYDLAREMTPGFYDDNATNANGDLYLSYGPSNTVWTTKTGTLAPTYMNRTNHYAVRYGAEITFEVQNANAITLFHSGSTTSAVQVCAVRVGTSARTCETQTLVGKSNSTFTTPFTIVGNYYVSITNLKHNLPFYVDAIGVFATTTLSEGIYQENNPGLTFTGTWTSAAEAVATDKFAKNTKVNGDKLEFAFNGTGFSIVLSESTTTSQTYNICVDGGLTVGGVTCSVIASTPLTPVTATTGRRAVALTYVGLTAANYTVRLTNTDANVAHPLVVDRVDILGALAGTKQIGTTITGNVDNTDPRITYFPFNVYTVVAAAAASGGNQYTMLMQGSVAYFEINNAAGTLDFEYVRQTAATYGNVQVCSGGAGQISGTGITCTGNVTVPTLNPFSNTVAPVGYQKSQPVTINGTGVRWVILRNADGKIMPLDFIRPTIAGVPLTAGYFEETHPELSYVNGSGAATTFTPVLVASASGGSTLATTTVNDALLFDFTGTGFSTYFTLDPKADAVRICWSSGAGGTLANTQAGTCQIVTPPPPPPVDNQSYDNQSATVRYKAARTILGLAQGSYTASVQMLGDNSIPAVHAATALPITMQIDAVQIYGDALPANVLNTIGIRYETSYVNRAADKNFLYYGTGWLSYSGTAYKLYSGSNYDRITGVIGAGILFQTNNADSIILYRQTAAGYAPVEVCATIISNGNRKCTIVQNNAGAGYQKAIGVPLNGSGAQQVSIVTLDGGSFALDAIQLTNSTAALTAGFYDDTYPGLKFTDNPGTGNGAWATVFSAAYSGGSVHQTTVSAGIIPANGDILSFTFTGTGFEIGTGIDRFGGEMEVCYDGILSSNTCFTYQNESATVSNLVSRSATGLPSDTYLVRVRHAEDGNTTIAPIGPRPLAYATSKLRIDYVNIFNNALPPEVTQSGLYNEDSASGGVPYLQLLPSARWTSFSGTAAAAFSNKSYVGVVDNAKKLVATYAGPSATLRVQVPAGGATVVLYTGAAISTNTNRLLVCANNVSGTDTTPVPPAGDCTIVTDLRTSSQIVLNNVTGNPYKLPALGGAGTVTLTFRALTPGLFRIDGFQLIQGGTLTAGIYDDFLFGTDPASPIQAAGTWTLAPATSSKLASAYGGTQALGQSTNATGDDPTLKFKFLGTGFSIITTVDSVGADMQICYAPTDGFDGTFNGSAGEVCKIVTTDTTGPTATDWANKNGNQPKPTVAYKYGFTVHNLKSNPTGGADDSYTVEVRMVDTTLAATDRLKVDAIAVFSNIADANKIVLTSAPNGQYYDNTAAGIRYEPGAFWSSNTTTTGPLTGPWNKTVHASSTVGAIAQFDMNGNGFILYQTATTTGSKWVRVCVRSVLGEECSEFNQNTGKATYFTPIAFYGLGALVDHEVVIENRDHGRNLSIDGLKIIP